MGVNVAHGVLIFAIVYRCLSSCIGGCIFGILAFFASTDVLLFCVNCLEWTRPLFCPVLSLCFAVHCPLLHIARRFFRVMVICLGPTGQSLHRNPSDAKPQLT